MSKRDNLKDYLIDLYQGIAAKKPGASRNPQRFRAEIESIRGGRSVPWDEDLTVIGVPASGETAVGTVFGDITPSVSIVQPSKYFLGSIPLTASIAVNEINLTVTKGE
jgi:hypothetical protein